MDPVKRLSDTLSHVNINSSGSSQTSSSGVTNSSSNSTISSKKTFSWKLDAPEFVPRNVAATNTVPLVTTSTTQFATSSVVTTSIPISVGLHTNSYVASAAEIAAANYDQTLQHIFSYVDWIVNELQDNPENFESLSSQLLGFIHQNVFDKETLLAVFARLLDAAITIENFSYICTRLMVGVHDNFNVKASNMQNCQPSTCRDCLVDALEQEFEARKAVLELQKSLGGGDSAVDPLATQRLFIFVNALCMFSTLLSIQGKPLRALVNAIYVILTKIVEQRFDAYVRFGIQTLKTVGAHLESTEKLEANPNSRDQTPQMDGLIDLLECIGTEADSVLSDNTKFMIRNLRGVRRHWAYVAPPPPSPIQPAPEQQQPLAAREAGSNGGDYYSESYRGSENGRNIQNASAELSNYLDTSNPNMIPPSFASFLEDSFNGSDMAAAAMYYHPMPDNYNVTSAMGPGGQPHQQSGDASRVLEQSSSALFFTPQSLTPAETAFFERVCFESVAGGDVPANVAGMVNTSSDDETIADAYEEFLRNMGQAPPRQ